MIDAILQILIYILIIDIIISYFPDLRSQKWAQSLHEVAEIPQRPIRNLLPRNLPLDPTTMIVIILIQILMHFV